MKKAKKFDLRARNKKQWLDAAGGLWDLAATKCNPNAIRILAEMIGLDKIVLLLLRKNSGDVTADAEAVKTIAQSIEREQSQRR